MKLDPNRLWAKSCSGDLPPVKVPSLLLEQHLKDVYAAAEHTLDASADDQLLALGLDPHKWGDQFRRCILFAAAVHDLGKANNQFQDMLLGRRDVQIHPQALRHEWVSILILDRLRDYSIKAVCGDEKLWAFCQWAIAGHHPALDHPSPPEKLPPGSGTDIELLCDYDDFAKILEWLSQTFGLGQPPSVGRIRLSLIDQVFSDICRWFLKAKRLWGILDAGEKRLAAAVKAALIAVDVAGSAIPRYAGRSPQCGWQWISLGLRNRPDSQELQAIIDYRLRGRPPRAFQEEVAQSTAPVTLVKAGCGTGKTLAAYMWAQRQCPGKRLYICYPTTGTATEGFRDYLYPDDEYLSDNNDPIAQRVRDVGGRLFHSRRDVDFEIILNNGRDLTDPHDELMRIEALEAWSTPVAVCTVDTVLGLLQNYRRGLFAWPALAGSAFAFDEIHSYDPKLFGTLLRFLEEFRGVPILLMTASLPAAYEQAIRHVLQQRGVALSVIQGPEELECLPRYHQWPDAAADPVTTARQILEQGGKVLWVCNTVERAMVTADNLRTQGLQPLIYHSRFRYIDRVQRHREVIKAFRGSGSALAVCTQVAEMSLDISADLLITEEAPVAALIQRMGRLNRRAACNNDPTCPFVVIPVESPAPYTQAELDEAREWLKRLPPRHISQRDLVGAWIQKCHDQILPGSSPWLDGGPQTTVAELRKLTPGINVILESDEQEVLNSLRSLMRYVLPMPPPPTKEWKSWCRYRGIVVAPKESIIYDPMRGASWAK